MTPLPPASPGRATFLGGGLFEWLLLPVFVLAATHTEIAGNPAGAGTSFAIRTVAMALVLLALLSRGGARVPQSHIMLALAASAYFIFINIANPTVFAGMGTVFIFTGLLTASLALGPARATVLFLVRGYLVFNLLGLALGAVLLQAGSIVDLHRMVFPWSAARLGTFLSVVRITGFQIEPGSYSNTVYLFVLLSGMLRGRLLGRIEVVAIASTLVTLAAWAVIGVGVYAAAAALQVLLSGSTATRVGRWLALLVLVAALAPSVPLLLAGYADNDFIRYFVERFSGDEGKGSLYLKVQAFEAWRTYLWLDMALGRPMSETFCPYCASPQDLGTLLNLFFYFGLVAASVLMLRFVTSIWRALGPAFLVATLPLLVSKFFFYDPLVWLTLGIGMFAAAPVRAAVETRPAYP